MGEKVTAMNVEMEHRAERLAELFPPPKYHVELIANETAILVVNEETGVRVGVSEHDFELEPEGEAELEYLRSALH
jgi:hypothetical protein